MSTGDPFEIKPEKFGRYVLLDRIGLGGMAEVFRAVMPGAQGFKRTFVVKRIIGDRAQSPYFVEMFVREARINAILHHPNIVQVFDFGEVGGTYFLAMEYVRGRDVSALARRLRERHHPCPAGVAAFVAHEVAEALAYAHAQTGPDGAPLNVVHRDVSPSNIICQRDGGVKLLDFGIAEALTEPEVEKAGQRIFKGKAAYVAPERIKDQAADGRSDLFSLGVVLWELLAGRKLFRAKDDVETLKNVLEMPVPALSSIRPDISGAPQLDRVVQRALARDPAERYATGYEMAEDLEDALTALGYQPRVLPALLRDLFGAELSSRQIPAASLTPELLAACATDGTGTAPTPGATPYPHAREISIPLVTRDVPRRSRWAWWVIASLGSATLAILLLGRGGGGQAKATPQVAPPIETATAAPPVPTAPSRAEPAPPEPAAEAPARPAHRPRGPAKGRIARGLSIDPFAEAASRHGR